MRSSCRVDAEKIPYIRQCMPCKYAINAMREALSGFYAGEYWWNLGMPGLIALGCITAAFIMYAPGKRLNTLPENAKAKTGIMI